MSQLSAVCDGTVGAPPIDEIECPSCHKSDWEQSSHAGDYSQPYTLRCRCGHGTLEYQDPIAPLILSVAQALFWGVDLSPATFIPIAARVRGAGIIDEISHRRWFQRRPKQYQDWPAVLEINCTCGGLVHLEGPANHSPGDGTLDCDNPAHQGECGACGVYFTAEMPPTERPEYQRELETWQNEEPKLPEWIEIPYRRAPATKP